MKSLDKTVYPGEPVETFYLLSFLHQDENGNTYHVVKVHDRNGNAWTSPITYGYGEQYKQTALKLINGGLGKEYQYNNPYEPATYIRLQLIFGPWYVNSGESLRRVLKNFELISRNLGTFL